VVPSLASVLSVLNCHLSILGLESSIVPALPGRILATGYTIMPVLNSSPQARLIVSSRGVLMDLNARAFRTIRAGLDDRPTTEEPKKTAARKGELIGGPRAPDPFSLGRRQIARVASKARWH